MWARDAFRSVMFGAIPCCFSILGLFVVLNPSVRACVAYNHIYVTKIQIHGISCFTRTSSLALVVP